jgi:hypothetical protein
MDFGTAHTLIGNGVATRDLSNEETEIKKFRIYI